MRYLPTKIRALNILGRKMFESHSEFYMITSIGVVAPLYDVQLDMSMMEVNPFVLPGVAVEQFRYLVHQGNIHIGGKQSDEEIPPSDRDFDISYYKDIDMYWEKDSDTVTWNLFECRERYGEHYEEFYVPPRMSFHYQYIIALFLLRHILGLEKHSKFILELDSIGSRNVYQDMDIFSCKQTIDWYNDAIQVKLDKAVEKSIDIDYSIFCRNAFVSKKYRFYSIQEKKSLMQREGFKVGSILVLWERTGMCKNNTFGRIKSAITIKIKSINRDSLVFDTFALNKTYEEVYLEYLSMSKENQDLYSDILTKRPAVASMSIPFASIGIGQHFLDEEYIIDKFDARDKVIKTVTIDDEFKTIEMSCVDAIYWILRQYNMEFDRDIFAEMYKPKEGFLYDNVENSDN